MVSPMRYITFSRLFVCVLFFNAPALARDAGYALECAADASATKLIVSFLETDVDKRVRYVMNDSGKMWDEHEWLADKFIVRSFRQSKDSAVPILISSLEIERESLRAVLVPIDAAAIASTLQCQQWSPRTRNK